MPIPFAQGFQIGSAELIDTRFLLTKAEMAQILTQPTRWPEYYFCICKDDGKFYIFNRSSGTASFKSYEEVIDMPAALEHAIEDSLADLTGKFAVVIPGALKEAIEGQEKDSGLAVDDDGNIAINYNADHFQINGNKLDLNIDLIQAV